MLKKIVSFLCLLLAFSSVAFAVEEENSPVMTLSSQVFNKYVDDAGFAWSDRAVVQSELTIFVGRGLYVGMWHSASLRSVAGVDEEGFALEDFGNENNPYAGWSGEILGLDIDLGLTYIDVAPVFSYAQGDIVQLYGEVGKEFSVSEAHALTPSAKVEYGIPVRGSMDGQDGLYFYLRLEHGWTVSESLGLTQKAALTIDAGAYGNDNALVGTYEVSGSYALTDWLSADASVRLIGPFTSVDDGRNAQVVVGGGLSMSF